MQQKPRTRFWPVLFLLTLLALGLDGAGNPHLAYDAEHLYGDGICATDRDYKAVRVVSFDRP
jgi:hypothetical protein